MTNDLVLLGTKGGPAIRQGGAMPTCSLLRLDGKSILVDCGIGVSRSVVEAGVSLLDLDAIFITHLHSDHVVELGPLIYTAWTTGLNKPLTVYGPEGSEDYWRHFLKAMAFDHAIRIDDEGRPEIAGMIRFETLNEGFETALDGVAVRALRVDHPPVTECYALRFEGGGQSVVFSADTCYFPPLARFAAGADVLVHEAMLTAGVEKLVARTASAGRLREHLLASHTPAADVGRIASDAMVGQLVLNHLVPADDPDFGEADWKDEVSRTWNGPLVVGRDGLRIPLGGQGGDGSRG
ncbi:MBL fold metallo-hydrolase [Leisingera methylohalidivorans]|uniref:Hydrolase n=1 Tax=Leisingera methylohalidivorans DSM 14336 TaxID=999552 RepID=V9W069_9RHOB|nr:MBL fold metallo-hydrolase [Leisingera methylohalidivorans]AHD03573.1 hydrolase [Leisingera methylohalidivorans DSM 14336]